MRFFAAIFLAFPAVFQAQQHSECDKITLVKCFIDILDDWAWTLYELKDNVVTITNEQCAHLSRLDKCVKDQIPPDTVESLKMDKYQHKCSHDEIVEVSETVSDLLTHRRNAGSFLKSYYLLTYSCSAEGQTILKDHRECLRNEEIGQMTLKAGTYMSTKFQDKGGDEDVCEQINKQLDEYMISTHGLCGKEAAARLMCKSLINMFKGMHADIIESCDLRCNIPKTAEESKETNTLPESHDLVANDQEALNRAKTAPVRCLSQIISLVLVFVLLR